MRAFKTRQGFVCAAALAMSVVSTVTPVHAEWWQERGDNAVEIAGSALRNGSEPLAARDGMGDDDGLLQLALQLPATETTRINETFITVQPQGLNQRDTRQVEFLNLLRSNFHEKAINSATKPALWNPGKGNDAGGTSTPVGDPFGFFDTPRQNFTDRQFGRFGVANANGAGLQRRERLECNRLRNWAPTPESLLIAPSANSNTIDKRSSQWIGPLPPLEHLHG